MSGVSQTIARELVTNCGSFELASDSGASFRDHQPIPFHLNIHTIFNSVLWILNMNKLFLIKLWKCTLFCACILHVACQKVVLKYLCK